MSNSVTRAATPANAFEQNMQSIQDYAKTMANLSLTGDSNIDPIFTQSKNDSMVWYNTIYPTYLNMPNVINQNASSIDNGLTLLTQLASQLQQQSGNDIIRSNINQQAAALQNTIKNLQQQFVSLSNSLVVFKTNLSKDYNSLQMGASNLDSEAKNTSIQIQEQYGNLDSLENATCPNQNSIDACEQLIDKLKQQMDGIFNAQNKTNSIINLCQNALNALSYLGGFWNNAAADAANCIVALIQLQRDPDNLLQIDLQLNISNWNGFKKLMQDADATASVLLNEK